MAAGKGQVKARIISGRISFFIANTPVASYFKPNPVVKTQKRKEEMCEAVHMNWKFFIDNRCNVSLS